MSRYFKVILNVPHDKMDEIETADYVNIVQYVSGDLANGILTLL